MKSTFFLFLLIIVTYNAPCQTSVNQLDNGGNRHGVWRKFFDKTKQLRYEGQFDHGKEIGIFNFYTLNNGISVLSATKRFNNTNDKAQVTFMSSNGSIISKGQMNKKLFVGEWVFYHNNSTAILSKEVYNDQGELEGDKHVFYKSGAKAETSYYVQGKLNGISQWYAENGTLLKEFNYKNDELDGISKYYDNTGLLEAVGAYKRDRKHGIWKYYKNGKLIETKDHTQRSKNPKKQ